MKVIMIPAKTKSEQAAGVLRQLLQVAAYCRVSTDSEEQLNSYKNQKAYYTEKIQKNDGWQFAGIFADEGITGTSMKKRTEFNRMIAACKRGKIDLILTKSIARFARNTVDCLETVRMLKRLGIGVYFEEQNINSLEETSEFMITMHSSFAQAESESISKNVAWGIRKSMEAGNVSIQYRYLMGYRKGADNKPEIVPEEAEIIRGIYQSYVEGASLGEIKKRLETEQITSPNGSKLWSVSTLRSILKNEKYMGDALLQKTFVTDCISKKVKKNNGELPMYYVKDHHAPIVSRELFARVQAELTRRSSKRKVSTKESKTAQGKYSSKYALTERLVCGECGSAYKRCTWSWNGKKKVVWRCISRLENGKKYCRNSPSMEESKLQAAIMTAIRQYAPPKETVTETLEIAMQATVDADVEMSWPYRLEQLTQEQERLVDQMMVDMKNDDLAQQLRAVTEQKKALLEQHDGEPEMSETNIIDSNELHAWMMEQLEQAENYSENLVRKVIAQITVESKNSIDIRFYGDDKEYTQNVED